MHIAVVTGNEELGFVVWALRWLRGHVSVEEDRASMEEAWSCKTLDKWSELQTLAKGLNRTGGGNGMSVGEIVDAKLIRVRSIIALALLKSEGTVIKAIWGKPDGSPVGASSDAPGLSTGGLSGQA